VDSLIGWTQASSHLTARKNARFALLCLMDLTVIKIPYMLHLYNSSQTIQRFLHLTISRFHLTIALVCMPVADSLCSGCG